MKKSVIAKLGAIAIIFAFLTAVSISAVEGYRASQSAGTEQTIHEQNSGTAMVVVFAMMALPAIASLRPSMSLGLKNIVNRQGTVMTDLQSFLLDYLDAFGQADTQKAIQNNKIFFNPITYYIRYVVTGLSGKQKILGESTNKVVGTTNFNLGYLPKFTNFAFNKIGVSGVDDSTSASVAAYALTGWSGVRGTVDKAIGNGELIISSARNVIFENPIAPLLREASNTAGPIGTIDYELEQPRVLKENELVEMEVNFGSNTVASTAAHTFGIEVRLSGVEVRLKG